MAISIHLGLFLKVKVAYRIFFGAAIFQKFIFICLVFLIFFGKQKMLGPILRMKKK